MMAREETESVTLVTGTACCVGWRVASHLQGASAAVRSPATGPGLASLPGSTVISQTDTNPVV